MDHNENNQTDILINRYLTGNASAQEIEDLFRWIQLDGNNKKYFQRQQDIWSYLNPAINIKDIDTGSAEKKVLRKSGIMAERHPVFRKLLVLWSRIAAVIALPLIALAGYLMAVHGASPLPDDVTIATKFGSLSRTHLPDGTAVCLNANSTLTYSPAMNGKGTRNVMLQGEAYFEVKADAEHPFKVNTPYMTVTATGTEFNVNAYDSSASVTLINGRVNVGVENQSMTLNPSEHLSLADGRAVINGHIDTEKYCCWKDGMLIFDDEPLVNICNTLQQMYDGESDVAPELASLTFRMMLNGENISEIMRFLELAAPVRCELEERKTAGETASSRPKVRITPL